MFFDIALSHGLSIDMIVGNHCTYHKNTNEINSPELLLSDYKNIRVFEKPTTIEIDSVKICMMPWICSDNYQESTWELSHTEAKLCMGHFEIAGFSMYRGMTSEDGLERKTFSKFDRTFSGHYHHKSDSNNIYYLGNPYPLTWSDFDDPRGFHIFDLHTYDLEFIQNPNEMFHKIHYDDVNDSKEHITSINMTKYTSTYVKVIVVNKSNPSLFDDFLSRLYESSPIDVSIIEEMIELTDVFDEDSLTIDDTISTIDKYVDSVYNDGIDNNKLKTMMREIYVEALSLE